MNIPIEMIEAGTRLRGVSADTVATLAASVATVGLINPITVYERGIIRANLSVRGWGLIAGLHRLEACRSLGMTEVPAHVVTLGEIERQLAECDENLCGTKLTPSERAMFTARRKQAYEALHPETRHGAVGNGRGKSCQVGDSTHSRFSADTSAKTGATERVVQRDASRGERIDDAVLSDIRGTALDKGVNLDAIAAVPKQEQRAAVRHMRQTQANKQNKLTKANRQARLDQQNAWGEEVKRVQEEAAALIVEALGEGRGKVLELLNKLPSYSSINFPLIQLLTKRVVP